LHVAWISGKEIHEKAHRGLNRIEATQCHIKAGRDRDVGFLAPPAQIRTCGTTAYGSCLES
jgi:hypothetical protein